MIKITKLKTAINNRDSIVKLMDSDSDSFCKTVRREGVILYDIESKDNFERVTYYYYSGYICNVTMLHGEFDSSGIYIYENLRHIHNLIDTEFKKLALI